MVPAGFFKKTWLFYVIGLTSSLTSCKVAHYFFTIPHQPYNQYRGQGKMIFEGVKLMFIGMTTVLLFLFLMILLIQLTSYLTRGATAREIEGIRLARELLAQKKKKAAASDTDEDIAVIAAAVTAYEVERFAQV